MAFFDRVMAVERIVKGASVPKQERWLLRTGADINAWNAKEFAKRPAGQTPQQALQEWRATHDALRKAVAGLTDADLDKKAWMPLVFGWVTVRDVVGGCALHGAGEYTELWLRLKKKAPEPPPEAMRLRLEMFMPLVGSLAAHLAPKSAKFTAVWNLTGPAGGTWTFRIADGACTVAEETAQKRDFEITMSPIVFEMIGRKMGNPLLLMLTRQVKVKGFSKMGTFGKLFAEPKPDQVIAPREAVAESANP